MTLVIGTRPEAIKLAPVAMALQARGLCPRIVLTGQHPDLDGASFGLASLPIIGLGCAGLPRPNDHADLVARRLAPLLRDCDMVLVQGDTSSALGGALAGARAGVPVAHVEAGLRSHDRANPWPEEDFRIAIDACASLLFAPTGTSAGNLRREGVDGTVHVTGNTGVDALLAAMPLLRSPEPRDPTRRKLLVTCHRRESWGEGLDAIASALKQIANSWALDIRVVLHPNPRIAEHMRTLLGGAAGVTLLDPCGHLEMLQLIRDSDLVLSDSGGVQEEAPTLGVPLLVLRDVTERPEGVATGNVRIVGRSREGIVAAVSRLLADDMALAAMAVPSMPYGDGRASERIAAAIEDWLEARSSGSQPDRLRA